MEGDSMKLLLTTIILLVFSFSGFAKKNKVILLHFEMDYTKEAKPGTKTDFPVSVTYLDKKSFSNQKGKTFMCSISAGNDQQRFKCNIPKLDKTWLKSNTESARKIASHAFNHKFNRKHKAEYIGEDIYRFLDKNHEFYVKIRRPIVRDDSLACKILVRTFKNKGDISCWSTLHPKDESKKVLFRGIDISSERNSFSKRWSFLIPHRKLAEYIYNRRTGGSIVLSKHSYKVFINLHSYYHQLQLFQVEDKLNPSRTVDIHSELFLDWDISPLVR